jgi:DUF1365 family protein
MSVPDSRSSRNSRPASCLYRGWIRHRRYAPREHEFRYPLFLAYLDLDQLDSVFAGRWLWSSRRPALARFDRRDHLGDPDVPLATAVRDLVAAETGRRPEGPIRLLTNLRYFGHCFNPVSFYYCFDAAGQNVETLVAEVHNTPWGERHCYVLAEADTPHGRTSIRYRSSKRFHVSPFMSMDMEYEWTTTVPGSRLVVNIENFESDTRLFDATLVLRRREISGRELARTLLRFPFMTVRVVLWIYWEAFRLWLKKTPFHPHPDTLPSSPPPGQ